MSMDEQEVRRIVSECLNETIDDLVQFVDRYLAYAVAELKAEMEANRKLTDLVPPAVGGSLDQE
jgi:hypothetical protein